MSESSVKQPGMSQSTSAESVPARTHHAVTPYWWAVGTIAWKDLRAEFRSRELVNTMVLYTLMTVLVFSLALDLDANARRSVVVGVLWVTVIFAGMLGLGRSLSAEKDRGSLDALLLAPLARSALFFGKMLANLLFVLIVTVILLLLLTVLFNATLFTPLMLLTVGLGVLGYTTAGTLVASMSVHARARETLLPILLIPVMLPVMLFAVNASNAILEELPAREYMPWVQMLAGIDIVFILGGYLLFDFVVEE